METTKRLRLINKKIRYLESALSYLGRCIVNRNMKGISCVDLIEEHDARERELKAYQAEWTRLTSRKLEVA